MNKQCSICKSYRTYVRKEGWESWRFHNRKRVCKKCYNKLFDNPKRILFKDKRIVLNKIPRNGVCNKCGKKKGDKYVNNKGKEKTIKRTGIHHKEYNDNDILKHTTELCNSCHGKESMKERWL